MILSFFFLIQNFSFPFLVLSTDKEELEYDSLGFSKQSMQMLFNRWTGSINGGKNFHEVNGTQMTSSDYFSFHSFDLLSPLPPTGARGKEPSCWCRRCKRCRIQALLWDYPLEEGMETLYSILAWRIPWTEESGGQQSIGSKRFGQDWRHLACIHACLGILTDTILPYFDHCF